MKKLLLSAVLSVPLMFVSCEKNDDTDSDQDNQTQNDGFWELDCYYTTDSVTTTYCDSIWIGDTINQGYYKTVCDSVWINDSTVAPPQAYWDLECETVWVNTNSNGGANNNGYWKEECQTGFQIITTQVCDSVWIDNSDNGNQNDSTDNSNGNDGVDSTSHNANGSW